VIDEDEGVERPRHVYLYSITEKGEGRLVYILESLETREPKRKAAANRG
jgi:hypothetical protein